VSSISLISYFQNLFTFEIYETSVVFIKVFGAKYLTFFLVKYWWPLTRGLPPIRVFYVHMAQNQDALQEFSKLSFIHTSVMLIIKQTCVFSISNLQSNSLCSQNTHFNTRRHKLNKQPLIATIIHFTRQKLQKKRKIV